MTYLYTGSTDVWLSVRCTCYFLYYDMKWCTFCEDCCTDFP